jgi:predicted nucleic acid-binding protein
VRFLLDTDVIAETRRRTPDVNVTAWLDRTDPDAVFVSVLTLGELAKGVAPVGRRDAAAGAALRRWLDGIRVLYADRLVGVDAEVAEEWGRLSTARPLTAINGLLAATALVHGLTLVTRNGSDLVDSGIAVVNPWEP